jgi:hypothetical protein
MQISSGASSGSMSVSCRQAMLRNKRRTSTLIDDPGRQGDDGDAGAEMDYGGES